MKKSLTVRELVSYALFIALVYVATRFINIPGPTEGGLFHLGNVVAFTIAIVFGKKSGAIAAGFGMALFDLTSPYAIWTPFTFVIRFLMGYLLGDLAKRYEGNKVKNSMMIALGIILSTIIMILGYYVTEVILFRNFYTPLQSIFGNMMQCIVGTIGAVPLSMSLKIGLRKRKIKTV